MTKKIKEIELKLKVIWEGVGMCQICHKQTKIKLFGLIQEIGDKKLIWHFLPRKCQNVILCDKCKKHFNVTKYYEDCNEAAKDLEIYKYIINIEPVSNENK
jgi:hypothetical protein